MLKIKLSPIGKRHAIQYRLVVTEERSKITGSPVAYLGYYHPRHDTLEVDQAAVTSWMKKGAQPTPKVRQLLKLS